MFTIQGITSAKEASQVNGKFGSYEIAANNQVLPQLHAITK